jgi:type I restriction enzyme S subunit
MSLDGIVVPKGWELQELNELAKNEKNSIRRGPWGGAILKSDFTNDGYKVYQQKNVIYDDFAFGDYFISKEKFEKLKEFSLEPGDIVITYAGTVGKISIVPDSAKPGVMNQNLLKISLNQKRIIPILLIYFLKTSIFWDQVKSRGSAMVAFPPTKKLLKTKIPLPPFTTQKQIVVKLDHILGELEVKKNQILELNTTKKLTDFIESNKFSILQLIRTGFYMGENWKDCPKIKIGDITKVTSGSTPSRDNQEYWNGDIPWIKSGELLDDDIADSLEHISKKGLENSSAKLFPKDTVLIALYGQGKTRGKTGRLLIESSTNQAVCGIFPNSNFLSEYIQFWIRSMYWELRKTAVGGAQPNWNTSTIKEIEIILPPINEQKNIVKKLKKKLHETSQFQKYIRDIIKQKENNIKYINHIQSSILDSAFSGKLIQ